MKKLVLAAVIALGSLSVFATSNSISDEFLKIQLVNEEFVEISIEELPQAIKDAFAADFEGAEIAKAYVNEEKKYKLEVTIGEEATTLYATEAGEWINE
ncbi:hypothetical protein [Ascidiimonas sp. W6]|uniref:hypothetical protein n=1 Tax=Ascidiimonas meishanensis TaxID=3128903 RepID=UPI0030EC3135